MIDKEYGLPIEEISCPSCGRSYKQKKIICRTCQECKTCCKKGNLCTSPNYVPARTIIEMDILGK